MTGCLGPTREHFLQHVLPKNFVKIRYYGFLSANRKNLLAVAKYLLGYTVGSVVVPAPDKQYIICPHCGRKLRWVKSLPKPTKAPP